MPLTILDKIHLTGIPQPPIAPTHTITQGSSGRIYMSDELNHRILMLDSHGAYCGSIGASGTGPGEFRYPRGLAIVKSEGGELLAVCDAWNHRIQFFTSDGTFVRSIGAFGDGQNFFNEPSVVLPYGTHSIAVLDRGNHRIKVCSLSGETIAIHGTYVPYIYNRFPDELESVLHSHEGKQRYYECGYNYPEGMAISPDGAFVVADTGNRRISILGPSREHWKIIEFDGKNPAYSYPKSVAVLPDGNIVAWVQADAALWLIEGSAPHRLERLPCPDLVSTHCRPAILSEPGDTFLIVDGLQEVLMRCRISDSFSQELIVPAAKMTINQGKLWIEYFGKAERTDTTASALAGFITLLKNCYLDHAENLARKESEYAERACENAILNKTEHAATNTGSGKKQVHSKPKPIVPLDQLEKELAGEENAYMQSLALPLLLFRSLHQGFDPETESFREMLEAKLKRGTEEFYTILQRLKECLVHGSDLRMAVRDCIRILQLHRNAHTLCKVLNAVPSIPSSEPRSYETPDLPAPLQQFKDDSRSFIENMYPILVLLCVEWGLDKSAEALISNDSYVPDSRDKLIFLITNAFAHRIAGASDQALRILDIVGTVSLAQLSEADRQNFFVEKGHALLNLDRAEDAIACYQKAQPERPDAPFYLRMNLALAYERSGYMDSAAKLYLLSMEKAKAAGKTDEYEAAATSAIRLHYLSGAFEGAVKMIGALPGELAGKPFFTNVRGSSLQYRPEGDANALPELSTLLSSNPDCAGLCLNLAVRHALQGNMSEAMGMIEQERQTFFWEVAVHFVKGVCLRINGRFAEALHEFIDSEGVVEFPPTAMELFLAAFGLRNPNATEQAMKSVLYNMQKDRCFCGFLNVPNSQRTLINEAIAHLNKRVEHQGHFLSFVWLNCSTLRYGRQGIETIPLPASETGP